MILAGLGLAIGALVPAISGNPEVFVDAAGLAERVESVFGERSVDVVKLDSGFDARVHVVGAAGGVDGDLAIHKGRNSW